jgi:hypothetical protein
MYKIKGGKLKVFSKYVTMKDGEHSLYVNKETGVVSHSPDQGDIVVTYTYSVETGHLSIDSHLTDMNLPYSTPTRARSWMNGRKISSGPLYEANKDINVYLEGFAFDFDYNAMVCTAMALKPFRWAGGRVCFESMYSTSGSASQAQYTALPASGSCGNALADVYGSGAGGVGDIATMYGASGVSGQQQAQQQDAVQFYGNATSVVFSYRSFRKYISFARGLSGIFECSIGQIGGHEASVEPEGDIPDPSGKSFQFSMFNLKQ